MRWGGGLQNREPGVPLEPRGLETDIDHPNTIRSNLLISGLRNKDP